MGSVIYVGKSDGNLFEEICQRLNANVDYGILPKGVAQPDSRLELTKYISIYYVRSSELDDYAKHIESLILRISKPRLNKITGSLVQAERPRAAKDD
jgi:hypothetical protein